MQRLKSHCVWMSFSCGSRLYEKLALKGALPVPRSSELLSLLRWPPTQCVLTSLRNAGDEGRWSGRYDDTWNCSTLNLLPQRDKNARSHQAANPQRRQCRNEMLTWDAIGGSEGHIGVSIWRDSDESPYRTNPNVYFFFTLNIFIEELSSFQ